MVEPFPVLIERVLSPASMAWYGGRRPQMSEVPTARPGTELVFEIGGEYLPRTKRGPLRVTEWHLVRATSVLLIDVRPRTLRLTIPIASPYPRWSFLVTVAYACQVDNVVTVAKHGLKYLFPALAGHLNSDPRLPWIAYDCASFHELRLRVNRRIRARHALQPPVMPGMRIDLSAVDVSVADGAGAVEANTERTTHVV